jgi:hypothetical protein
VYCKLPPYWTVQSTSKHLRTTHPSCLRAGRRHGPRYCMGHLRYVRLMSVDLLLAFTSLFGRKSDEPPEMDTKMSMCVNTARQVHKLNKAVYDQVISKIIVVNIYRCTLYGKDRCYRYVLSIRSRGRLVKF